MGRIDAEDLRILGPEEEKKRIEKKRGEEKK